MGRTIELSVGGPSDMEGSATPGARRRRRRPSLTQRQRDCIVLAARGKSDRCIAEALGISNQTVHKHVEAAKKAYAVSTRVELILRLLYLRQISLAEMVAPEV